MCFRINALAFLDILLNGACFLFLFSMKPLREHFFKELRSKASVIFNVAIKNFRDTICLVPSTVKEYLQLKVLRKFSTFLVVRFLFKFYCVCLLKNWQWSSMLFCLLTSWINLCFGLPRHGIAKRGRAGFQHLCDQRKIRPSISSPF